jgi:hypothetical protein
VAFDAIFLPLKFRNLTPKNRYERSRYPSCDAMVAPIMSVFNPPPFV